jgi:hypothetical protein
MSSVLLTGTEPANLAGHAARTSTEALSADAVRAIQEHSTNRRVPYYSRSLTLARGPVLGANCTHRGLDLRGPAGLTGLHYLGDALPHRRRVDHRSPRAGQIRVIGDCLSSVK